MSNREARKINQFFANFIAKLRKWLNQIGSPFRISRRFVRSLFNQSRRPGSSQAGFVLPTVVLVTTVVTLLTVTLVTRSADRARTAVNARVEQASRIAATPLIDRARVKIEQLINDDTLPKGIPSDIELFNVISDRNNTTALYTFGDETRLQLFDGSDTAIPATEPATATARRTSRTAWRVGLDTDGNGKLDTFGLYSIIFRKQDPNAAASVLGAKAAPMAEGALGANCVAADLAGSVAGGAADWYAQPGRLSKSFFVHAVTIPITDQALADGIANSTIPNDGSYEAYTGVPSFAALELQQDRFFKSQNPNAVWFDGDVEIYSRSSLKINGRIVAGGNLLVAPDASVPKEFYQVSDPFSCFYEEDNSKIIVAGNVVDGDTFATGAASTANTAVRVDLFRGKEIPPNQALTSPVAIAAGPTYINADNRSVEESGTSMVLNENAFEKRFNAVLKAALEIDTADTSSDKTTRPREVFDATEGGVSIKDAYSTYIRQRLRKVPFKEVPFGLNGGVDGDVYAPFASTNLAELTTKTKLPDEPGYDPLTQNYTTTLRDELFTAVNSGGTRQERKLKLEWSLPLVPSASPLQPYNDDFQNPGGFVPATATKAVNLKALAANKGFLTATSDEERKAKGVEQFIGDRILVGNNLPNRWLKKLDASGSTFEYASDRNKFFWAGGANTNTVLWDDPATEPRYRITQATPFPDLGNIARDASWEYQAAQDPSLPPYPKNSGSSNPTFTPITGGLRVVTGSGIYSRETARTFLPAPTVEQGRTAPAPYNNNDRRLIVWSDANPMTGAVAW
ncbi:MAG: hormogonium polysaccharide biosynthesis protein HpsA, partial [Pseudanabaenaceae cyanobacterium bins.68]|nr:hormogonium polysaccharide biosynthesis protein HpsA [Pseudanabaenaceae cyanobacterium bins.68]